MRTEKVCKDTLATKRVCFFILKRFLCEIVYQEKILQQNTWHKKQARKPCFNGKKVFWLVLHQYGPLLIFVVCFFLRIFSCALWKLRFSIKLSLNRILTCLICHKGHQSFYFRSESLFTKIDRNKVFHVWELKFFIKHSSTTSWEKNMKHLRIFQIKEKDNLLCSISAQKWGETRISSTLILV